MLIRLRDRFTWLHAAAALAAAVAPATAQPPGEPGCDEPTHHATHAVPDTPTDRATGPLQPGAAPHDHTVVHLGHDAPAVDHGPEGAEDGTGSPAPPSEAAGECAHCPTSDCGADAGCEVPTPPAEIATRSQVRQEPRVTGPCPSDVRPHTAPAPSLWCPPPRVIS